MSNATALADLIAQFLREVGDYLTWGMLVAIDAEIAKPRTKKWMDGILAVIPSEADLERIVDSDRRKNEAHAKFAKTGGELAAAVALHVAHYYFAEFTAACEHRPRWPHKSRTRLGRLRSCTIKRWAYNEKAVGVSGGFI